MADISQYLTVQEVADRLGVSVFTIRRYIRAGKLRAVKLDAAYRISREDMSEFLRSREISGPTIAAGERRVAGTSSSAARPESARTAASATAGQPPNSSESARS